jgi:hypothetical protein
MLKCYLYWAHYRILCRVAEKVSAAVVPADCQLLLHACHAAACSAAALSVLECGVSA